MSTAEAVSDVVEDAQEAADDVTEGRHAAEAETGEQDGGGVPFESEQTPALARTVEALLFLSADPLSPAELADAVQAGEGAVMAALAVLAEQYAPGMRGMLLRELGGGWTLSSDPESEDAARRLFSRPRVATLTPAQAETLAIVAYMQPVSRPEITRIRGVSADSASATLLERGLVEEAGHSQFGAVLYRTTTQFLKLFGLRDLDELPDVANWDPSPEEQAELRERLLRAGEARAGGQPQQAGGEAEDAGGEAEDVGGSAEDEDGRVVIQDLDAGGQTQDLAGPGQDVVGQPGQ